MTTQHVIRDSLARHPVARPDDDASHRLLICLHGGEHAWDPARDDLPFAGPAVIPYQRDRTIGGVAAEAFLSSHPDPWAAHGVVRKLAEAGIAAAAVPRVDESGDTFWGVHLVPDAPTANDPADTGRHNEQSADQSSCPGCGEPCRPRPTAAHRRGHPATGRAMTARARSTEGMRQARRADSEHKRQRALQAVQELEAAGEPITFATVARRADVSTWLVYAPGVKDAVLAARDRQRATPAPSAQARPEVPATGLRTDLALARAEVTRLRQERDALRAGMQRALGARLDQLGRQDLVERIDELTRHNEHLLGEVDRLTAQRDALRQQVPALEEDLAAARTSLRRMIREGNLPGCADAHERG